jgi:uncharacterized protein involved in outer membrane biogenesis
MRLPRKLALAFAAFAATAVILLVTVPLLFRGRIEKRLKSQINSAVDARVAWGDVGISALRDFPNVTLALDDVSIAGVRRFQGDTLVKVQRFRLVLDLASVVRNLRGRGQIVVREVELARPVVRLRVLKDGTANWNIARASAKDPAQQARPIAVTLRDLRIHEGTVTLDDRQSGLVASLQGLEHSLQGDFARSKVVLSSRTSADTASLRFAGVPYLNRVALELNADVAADLVARRFTFTNDSLRLNKLVLAFSGAAAMRDPNLALDLSFSAPSTAFADILSLVPAVYTRDFARLRTSGRMAVSGRVKGEYGPKAFPAFAVNARVENGAFRYPDLPLPARDISAELAVANPGGNVDSTVVNLKRFHAVIGSRPVDAAFVMRTPVSDPDVDLRVAGTVDLADVGRTVKLEGVKELSGLVAADVAVRTRLSQLDAARYDRVAARGTLGVTRLALRAAALPHALTIDSAMLRLSPRTAELTALSGRIGSSDVRGTGSLDNLLGFALRGEELRGRATVSSTNFDLNEWRSDDALEVVPVPPNVDFSLQASADRVTFGTLSIANARGALRVKDRRVTIDDFRMEMLRGAVVANGFYETTNLARPTFDVDLRVASVDIPTAFAALTTVQKLAPVARWAQGTVSTSFKVGGALGQNMLPLFDALSGRGSFETGPLALQGAPVLGKLADALSLEQVRNPAFEAVRSSFEIVDGRLHVRPFAVKMGPMSMTVAGSNGIDQSLKYDLALAVPRSELGAAADRTVAKLASQAGQAGIQLSATDIVELGAQVTGTVMAPTVRPNFAGVAASAGQAVKQSVQQAVENRVAAEKQRADSAADEARRRARAEADKLVAEAERRAVTIREEARTLAASVKREGGERADALVAKATNPAARIAAKAGADRVRREADQQADRMVREADARADATVLQARKQADALVPPASGP